jgi:hypothetical protein
MGGRLSGRLTGGGPSACSGFSTRPPNEGDFATNI